MGYIVRNGKSRYEQIPNTIAEYARCRDGFYVELTLRFQDKRNEIPGKYSL
jgi:hypothetical protein